MQEAHVQQISKTGEASRNKKGLQWSADLKESQIPALHFQRLLVQLQHFRSELGHIKPSPPVGHLPNLTAQQRPQYAPPQPA